MRSGRQHVLAVAAGLAGFVVAACGGGSSAPASPTPNPTTPTPGAACGALGAEAPSATAIVNGTECSTGASAVVLLSMRDRTGLASGACSGTVIAPRAVLTAAHCLDEDTATVTVWLGSGDPLAAESFAHHPNYGPNASSLDVGVVLLREDVGRRPIPVLVGRDARVGESAVVAGWGRDLFNIGTTLRAGMTTISSVGPILETLYTSSSSAVCSGDSGGPILVSQDNVWSVAGVTSAVSASGCLTGTNFFISVRNPSVTSFILGQVPNAARQ
jgi:trypsin